MNEQESMSLGMHGGAAVAVSIITAWLTKFFAAQKAEKAAESAAKNAQETNIRLALVEKGLERVERLLEEHGNAKERLALAEQAVKAAHARVDRLEGKE